MNQERIMKVLLAPAIDLARSGVCVNSLQAYILDVVKPIYLATPQAVQVYASQTRANSLVTTGETLRQPALAETLEALGHDGDGGDRG